MLYVFRLIKIGINVVNDDDFITILGCDGVIQLTANLTDSSACDIPCTGDDTLICGGSNHISIYTNGIPSPKIPTVAFMLQSDSDAAIVNIWEWVGCFRYFCLCVRPRRFSKSDFGLLK